MPEGALQPEVLWGSQEEEKFAARNILTNEPPDFSNSTHANYWLAKEGEVDDQGFVVRVGNSKRKIVGVHIRNTNTSKTNWATRTFKLEGSLLKEPERIAQRAKENTAQWTPEILKAEGEWDDLLNVTLEENQTLKSFFFDETTELRYLWFHLLSFYGKGGGLHYFAPILQSGECHTFSFTSFSNPSDVCMWTNWTGCDWFCDEEDPRNKTRRLQKKETELSQEVAHLCNESEVLGCYANCTGKYLVWIQFLLDLIHCISRSVHLWRLGRHRCLH